MSKVGNWGEVGIELFREIYTDYWNAEEWISDKILEIQHQGSAKSFPLRLYIGLDIDDEKESLPEGLREHIKLLNLDKQLYSVIVYFLVINTLTGETIYSFLGGKKLTEAVGLSSDEAHRLSLNFLESPNDLVKWYTKEGDIRVGYFGPDLLKYTKDIKESEKFFRIRSIDKGFWKNMVEIYINNCNKNQSVKDRLNRKSLLGEDDDVDNIKIIPASNELDISNIIFNILNNS